MKLESRFLINFAFIIVNSVIFIFRSIGVWIYGFCVLFIIGLIIVNSTTFIFNSKCFWNGSTFLWFVFLIFDLRFGSRFCSFIRDFFFTDVYWYECFLFFVKFYFDFFEMVLIFYVGFVFWLLILNYEYKDDIFI